MDKLTLYDAKNHFRFFDAARCRNILRGSAEASCGEANREVDFLPCLASRKDRERMVSGFIEGLVY
jgi:hypothetical protein